MKYVLPLRWVIALALPITACTVGPDYHAPKMPVPAGFAEAPGATTAEYAAFGGTAAWWKGFGDPTLDDLVTRALVANPDMGTAASRVREARLQ